jgi:hypothetical protein
MQPRSNMKLNPEDLAKITDFTLSHYNEHAEDFWEGTRDHNVNQNITALLKSIEGEPPYTILDFGITGSSLFSLLYYNFISW